MEERKEIPIEGRTMGFIFKWKRRETNEIWNKSDQWSTDNLESKSKLTKKNWIDILINFIAQRIFPTKGNVITHRNKIYIVEQTKRRLFYVSFGTNNF